MIDPPFGIVTESTMGPVPFAVQTALVEATHDHDVNVMPAGGVSVNVAITNLVMDAVNLGYQVVLPRDAVVGIPQAYADAVIDNTLALLATVTTVADLTAAWGVLEVGAPSQEEPA